MPRLKLISLIIPVILALATADCTHRTASSTQSLSGLQQMGLNGGGSRGSAGVSSIRREAIAETALSVGAQSGLAKRYSEIDRTLEIHARALDVSFNFESLLLKENVLPPVLLEAQDTMKKTGDTILRITDRSYEIKQQARFVAIAPNWRDYLYKKYSSPEEPHVTLLPRTAAEREIWATNVKKGWDYGVAQANRTFTDNLARLKQDYNGMVTYRRLLAQRMVSEPFVAVTELGVTSDDKNMGINDKILRIVVLPRFQDPNGWNPALSHKSIAMSEQGFSAGAKNSPAPEVTIAQPVVGYDR